MTTVNPTFTTIAGRTGGEEAVLVKWSALGNADSGAPVQLVGHPDKSIEIAGTFGSATCVLEGSNDDDGTGAVGTFVTLNDPNGNAISATSTLLKAVTEVTTWVRARTSGGSGTSLNATLLMRRSYR